MQGDRREERGPPKALDRTCGLVLQWKLPVLSASVGRAVAYFRKRGLRATATYAAIRATDAFADGWFGVDTFRSRDDIGVNGDSNPYTAAPYLLIWRLLHALPRRHALTLVDFGCGKGRALVAAGSQPFRRVIGVEYSDALAAAARENVRRMRHRRTGVDVVHADASNFRIPPDANVFYFFNPFGGETLARVVENIRGSLEHMPRHAWVLFVRDSQHFAPHAERASWLTLVRRVQLGHKISAGIYETHPRAPDRPQDRRNLGPILDRPE